MRLCAKPDLEKPAVQAARGVYSNTRNRAEVPKGLRLSLPDPCHGVESLEVVCTVHHGNSIEGDAELVQLSAPERREVALASIRRL